jgi:hypothetical protein
LQLLSHRIFVSLPTVVLGQQTLTQSMTVPGVTRTHVVHAPAIAEAILCPAPGLFTWVNFA